MQNSAVLLKAARNNKQCDKVKLWIVTTVFNLRIGLVVEYSSFC